MSENVSFRKKSLEYSGHVVEYSSHVVTSEGIKMQEGKMIKRICEYHAPTNVKGIEVFR